MMPKTDSRETETPTLEELLQVKRDERPSPEFWNRFERELHAKPWQGMVRRPSALARLWSATKVVVIPGLPAGAVAALALAAYTGGLIGPASEVSPVPAREVLVADAAPTPSADEAAPPQVQMESAADPHFVVGSFSATETQDTAFTTIASTHYMPASQRDGVHFAYNAIDQASHRSVSIAKVPVRSFY